MSLAGTAAITELWAKCKLAFGMGLSQTTASETLTVNLLNGSNTIIGTTTLPKAVASSQSDPHAGLMTAADKEKLDTMTDTKVRQTQIQPGDSNTYAILLSGSNSGSYVGATAKGAGLKYSQSTGLYVTQANATTPLPINGYLLDAACAKNVDTTLTAGSTSTNLPTSKAVVDFVATQVTGGSSFQGIVHANSTIEAANYVAGWYWSVGTAGTYVGQTCEVGDMVYAINTKSSAYSASDFTVVQNNIVEMTTQEVDAICV